ncbi:hypothetical protein [Pseudomonas syringae]|uniref:hypothetical protein n=1 Tax=Pseudomonas syringae TaxID=317 RepID=UPI0018D559CF|nr:hypothetical protein [Pseudomonas syringae]MCH5528038.1 hypothetical protein [Pseudomonas syringae pv. syringae]MCH5537685.1 hypothetical protein [Pseudomonas syringae pv. syringae]MCH5542700.1 hypothetical protein [Pseudomonas syringae pv. syringae]MCH5601440.1 hypothetical protein [Pseudomonas syringae pv. syringae]MCH5606352.1 hypothetical protein [Pseudomonas syringae pv. syringae]
MRDEDLYAIAAYLKTLPGSNTRSPRPLKASDKVMQQGANVYSAKRPAPPRSYSPSPTPA